MLQKLHIVCLDTNEKIMNKSSFAQFPPSFQHRKFNAMNMKMNIFIMKAIYRPLRRWYDEQKGGTDMSGTEFQTEQGVLTAYRGHSGRVTIPEGVREIGREAFANCGPLASVTFPAGLQVIGEAAFFRCTHLRWVKLPEGVTELGDRAFCGCEHMMSVSMPEGLRRIGREAFAHCRALESVTIPDSVEEVGEDVFVGCHRLREVRAGESWKATHPDLYEKLMIRI